tara:strand:+ start:103 stop:498 length:396 start_codon:yes stop_codon:yes gene_type:complete
MSDEVLTIKLTAREIDLIHQCIGTNIETVKRRHDPTDPMIADLLAELGELSDDLLEQRFNPDDLSGRTFQVSEDDFVDAGIQAREQVKASSRAAERRRAKSFGEFEVSKPDRKLSDQQLVDLWNPNDPTNW